MTDKTSVPATPPQPRLEFLARFTVNLHDPVLELGQTGPWGRRRIIPITGGRFAGPRLTGEVLPNGADWQIVQPDGLARIDTRYALRTDDGALIYIQTRGFRHGPEDVLSELFQGNPVDPNRYYFRVTVDFEAGDPRYAWLNRTVAIGAGMRLARSVVYDAYAVT